MWSTGSARSGEGVAMKCHFTTARWTLQYAVYRALKSLHIAMNIVYMRLRLFIASTYYPHSITYTPYSIFNPTNIRLLDTPVVAGRGSRAWGGGIVSPRRGSVGRAAGNRERLGWVLGSVAGPGVTKNVTKVTKLVIPAKARPRRACGCLGFAGGCRGGCKPRKPASDGHPRG